MSISKLPQNDSHRRVLSASAHKFIAAHAGGELGPSDNDADDVLKSRPKSGRPVDGKGAGHGKSGHTSVKGVQADAGVAKGHNQGFLDSKEHPKGDRRPSPRDDVSRYAHGPLS